MIDRPDYIHALLSYKDIPLVKILAGIRRSGKSTLLALYRQELLRQNVPTENIISQSYTSMELPDNYTKEMMYQDLKTAISNASDGQIYLLLDEVQEVEGWEKVVNSLLEQQKADIYVTGSNSKLMSSEISTYLTGRYVLLPVYTLSFREYLQFKVSSNKSTKELLQDYLHFGGFPVIALNNYDEHTAYQIVEGIYASVITNDISRRHAIKDIDLFNRVVRFIIENIGKTFSANSIVTFLKNEKRSLSVDTIYNYLEWLEQAFVIYRCSRYDLQGKAILKTQEKFYVADTALKYAILGFNPKGLAAMLENIVYFELRRRGYTVYVGKNATKEIDFIAIRQSERLYVQVTRQIPEHSDREEANLLEIKDNYPKYIVTLDEFACGNIDGIKIVQLADFLLMDSY